MLKIKSFEELDTALLDLGKAQAELGIQEAEMNKEIQLVTERYAESTAEYSGNIATLEDAIETFCMANKFEFDKTRSRTLNHGYVGFRTNPPKVMQLNKKWKVESSLAFLKKLFKSKFTRTKLEIDKEAILAEYARESLTDEDLAAVGLRIDQDETFTVEANWIEIKKTQAA